MSGLRDLDDRLVPRAAARLRRAVDSVSGQRRALRTRALAAAAPVRSGASALQRLDDRFARGPLAVVREVPQVGLVAVAAVFLAGAGVALARGGDDAPAGAPTTSVSASARVLGPEAGTEVQAYLDDVRERAVARAQEQPDVEHLALVSLSAYGTPREVAEVLAGLEVERAYLRVPADEPGEVLSADVTDLEADLAPLYAATATRKAEDQREFLRLAASLDAQTDEQRRFREFYELSARVAGREAEAYRTGCACVFAALVRGTAATLAELPALQGVRAVELAPPGVGPEELRVRPLGPDSTTTVEAGADPRPGGG